MFRSVLVAIFFAFITLIAGGIATTAQATSDTLGEWHLITPSLPYFPVHANLLPNGKVMIWPGDNGISGDDPRAWDSVDNSLTSLAKPGYDLFCVGHVSLADGSLFLAGGHISNFVGLPNATKYNYLTDTWTVLPNMNAGRWYPTTTVLANGDVLTISGDIDTTIGVNTLPQVFEVTTGTWRNLTGAQIQLDDYPRMFLVPNGKVFYAGSSPTTRYLNTSGTGLWSFVATRAGGYRDYGSAVMYAPGKILVMGGDQAPPKSSAEVIDLNQSSPSWRNVDPMQFPRRHVNATLLPDGKVLVTGGTSASGFNDPAGHVDAAELWDPITEQWTTLASSTGIPRIYHSTALLLPDGRIFSAGGNNHPEIEIYSPPYLFKGVRPTITSAPSGVAYGTSFSINTPDAASITKVTVLRIGSVTHAFNMGQVINELNFSVTTDGLNITAPSSPNIAPPGYYMLFILNGNGVPSIAKFIKIDTGALPIVSLASPENNATVAGTSVNIIAQASDNIGVAGVQFKLNGVNIGVEDTTSPFSIVWDSTTMADGQHILTAVARDTDGNLTTSSSVNITINNSTLLSDLVVTQLSYVNGIFTSTVKNQGTAATPAGVTIGVGYSVNNVWRTWGGVWGPLAAGASVTIGTKGDPYFIPNGTFTATAYVDDGKKIAELNDSNNQLSQGVTGGITDATPPTISITAPADGVTVSGTSVTLSADAVDNVGVAGVQFSVTGGYPFGEDATAPYSIDWDSTAVTNGPHTIEAVARDNAGNTSKSSIVVTVSNGTSTPLPDVVVTQLSYADGIFTSTVQNQGTEATPAGVSVGVGYLVDGEFKTWGSVAGPLAAGASVTIGTKGGAYVIPNGAHAITAHVDDVNRFAESNETNNKFSQSITVNNTQPIVSLSAPISGVTVAGTSVTVSANASDDVGVAGVQFKLDGNNLGAEDTTAPYSIPWDSTSVTDGQHTITAIARDTDGNTATSASINVTVNNTNPSLLPDVVVTQLSYADGIFTSTVKNQGGTATPAGVTVGVAYSVDGKNKTWGSIWGPLAAGATATIGTKGDAYIIPNGSHSIAAQVDDMNRFVESNETNNKFTRAIEVP
ncbi:hypothetical protein W03_20960 [Nitrosomonas sp. PY1]|uniref:Ig-like domain-containing protein n=1 Tax=Nitrosomonas sp. PY1 TaxID=1803906 RepID=UPI001FC8CDCC|nr:Ig-like domain-containing protein [Nitrosomonas sp. PY1]GKS70092.1 hypothetical protein W03_20960 [Nitrosomonas sp. PY1]